MFGYYLRLAALSFQRTPGLTVLMVLAIAAGISVCIMSLTLYHAISGNPVWWKSNQLYAVTMDAWAPDAPINDKRPDLPPNQLTYRDATWLAQSNIPKHKLAMFRTGAIVAGGTTGVEPTNAITRITYGDFFAMFEV